MDRIYDFGTHLMVLEKGISTFGEDVHSYFIVFDNKSRRDGYADVIYKKISHTPLSESFDNDNKAGYIANFYPYGSSLRDGERPRLGIGKGLMDVIIDDAKAMEIDFLYLAATNDTAKEFYCKNGFNEILGFHVYEL